MLRRLGIEGDYDRATISGYERGVREPPLPILLEYARAANVYVDVLIDDALDLPEHLPARKTSTGVRRSADKK
jgi:transcriptional regulator with XRE-family HTH domain